MAESWTVNSDISLIAFKSNLDQLYQKHKYLTYSAPRIGRDRSLSQNGLLHVWLAEYAASILGRDRKKVARDKGIMKGMKLDAKKKFLLHHPEHRGWMVHDVKGPMSGSEKRDYTSSADWKTGEMYVFLCWLQMLAANDGLILESKGKFEKLQREGI